MMNSNDQWFELAQIIVSDIVRHWRSIIMMMLVFAMGADMFLTLTYQPFYRSEATFALKTGNEYTTSSQVDQVSDIAAAFGYIISSNLFKQDIMEEMNTEVLDGYFETTEMAGTNIIKIAAVSSSPRTSYYMMVSMLNRYQDLSRMVLGNINIELMQDISIAEHPVNVNSHKNNLIRFGIIGFVLGVALFALLGLINDKVKLKEDMEVLGIPYLGSLSKEKKWFYLRGVQKKKAILISQLSTSFRFIEDMKKLRTVVERKCEKHGWKTILVTSCLENEGKSSVLSNLALALASNHKKVLIVDGDLRKPAVYKIFDLESNDGLYRVLDGQADLKDVILHDERHHLDFLIGHSSFTDAADRFDESRMQQLMHELKQQYDYILLDTVPSALFSDGVRMARLCDTSLLVVRQNFLSVKVVSETLDKLRLSRIPVLGYVLNFRLPLWWRRVGENGYVSHYGHYGYSSIRRRNGNGK